MERKLIKIEEHDNVAVAVESIKKGTDRYSRPD